QEQRVELLREVWAEGAKDAIHFGCFVENYSPGPVFVVKAEHFLDYMRERAVTQIVKQRAGAANHACFFADLVMRSQKIQCASHHMHHAKRMREPALLGALVGEHRKAELF